MEHSYWCSCSHNIVVKVLLIELNAHYCLVDCMLMHYSYWAVWCADTSRYHMQLRWTISDNLNYDLMLLVVELERESNSLLHCLIMCYFQALWPGGTFFTRIGVTQGNFDDTQINPIPFQVSQLGGSKVSKQSSFEEQLEAARRASDIKKMLFGEYSFLNVDNLIKFDVLSPSLLSFDRWMNIIISLSSFSWGIDFLNVVWYLSLLPIRFKINSLAMLKILIPWKFHIWQRGLGLCSVFCFNG